MLVVEAPSACDDPFQWPEQTKTLSCMCTWSPVLTEVPVTSLQGSRASPEPPHHLSPQQGLGTEGVPQVLALSPEMKMLLVSISVEARGKVSRGGGQAALCRDRDFLNCPTNAHRICRNLSCLLLPCFSGCPWSSPALSG